MYTAIVVYGTLAAYLSTLNFVLAAGHVVGCAGIIIPRLPQEEGILVDAFGEEYLEYRARVPALGWGTLWLNRVYQPATTTNSKSIQGVLSCVQKSRALTAAHRLGRRRC